MGRGKNCVHNQSLRLTEHSAHWDRRSLPSGLASNFSGWTSPCLLPFCRGNRDQFPSPNLAWKLVGESSHTIEATDSKARPRAVKVPDARPPNGSLLL